MNAADIMKRLQRVSPAKYSAREFNRDNLLDVLNHYKKLSVVYIDDEENVIFL